MLTRQDGDIQGAKKEKLFLQIYFVWSLTIHLLSLTHLQALCDDSMNLVVV